MSWLMKKFWKYTKSNPKKSKVKVYANQEKSLSLYKDID